MQGIRNISHPIGAFCVNRLPLDGHLQQHQHQHQEVSATDDNEDATLESLIKEDDSITDDDQPSESSARINASSLLRERYRQAVRKILTSGTNPDPLVKMNEYFQKIGVQSLKDSFQFHSKQKGAVAFWRCTFQCPVSGEKATSTLPIQLLDPHMPLPTDDEVLTILKSRMGTGVVIDGVVYYASKKMAKKMCALAVLLELPEEEKSKSKSTPHSPSTCMQDGQEEIATSLQPQSVPTGNGGTVALPTGRKRTKFPWWVHKLYELGVGTADISYREYSADSNSPDWKAEPTLLCCVLSVTKPIILTVIGKPSSSRNYTRNTAVGLLEAEIFRQLPGVFESEELEKAVDAPERQKRILQCDVSLSTFFQPLPSWACSSFHSKSPWYLYELILSTESGVLLAEDRMNLDPSVVTRIGILFPSDIEPPTLHGEVGIAPAIQARITIKGRNGHSDESVLVELRNRTVIDPLAVDTDGTGVVDRVESLKQFNQTLMDWKTYGKKSKTRDLSLDRNGRGAPQVGRAYLFAPLHQGQQSDSLNAVVHTKLSVDWQLVEEELEGVMQPFLVSSFHAWNLPLFGEIRTADLALIFILLGITVLAPCLTKMVRRPHLWCLLELSETLVAGVFFSFAILAGAASIVPPSKYLPWESLRNRFLCQRNLAYVLALSPCTAMTSFSDMPLMSPTTEAVEGHRRKYNLDLRKTSFVNYYLKKHGITLCFPREKVLNALPVEKQASHDMLNGMVSEQDSAVHLVPELVSLFPIPRDFLYSVGGLAGVFMPEIERAITVSWYSSTILQLSSDGASSQDGRSFMKQGTSVSKGRWIKYHCELSDSLSEATSLFPVSRYEGLEFLGDSVLGYFLALNAVVQNSSLAMDSDEIGDVISADGRNSALLGPALRSGLSRVIRAGKGSWQSLYSASASQKQADKLQADSILDSFFESPGAGETVELANSTLSDIVESMLAATYLSDTSGYLESAGEMEAKQLEAGGGVTVAFLEKLLPFCSTKENATCFKIFGPCLRVGYPFEMDVQWENRMDSIQTVVESCDATLLRLNKGFEIVRDKLSALSNRRAMSIPRLLEKREARALVLCALFDDSLDDIDIFNGSSPDDGAASNGRRNQLVDEHKTDGKTNMATVGDFLELALVRDNLYQVGVYGLQLMVTDEIFRRHPGAKPGDLHLLRTCVIADDVIVYVMIKAGIHRGLFDQASPNISDLESKIAIADIQGLSFWRERGGWLLDGGIDAFWHRCAQFCANPDGQRDGQTPQYPGLLGGRLFGESQKLPKSLTNELMFSFKSIVGALILSLGVKLTWICIGPLFEELLLLSADELRSEFGTGSTLISSYKAGGGPGQKKKKLGP
jgi:dsRNA-specific ribonuclease